MLATILSTIAGTAIAVQAAPLAAMPSSPSGGPPIARQDGLAGLEPLADEELAAQRGGFAWQGVEIALGAEIRTYLNGELVLQTNVSWGPAGANTTQLVSGALAPPAAEQLQAGILTGGGITMRVGDESVFLANQGQTAIMHRTDGAIQNVLVNRASNVEARQEIDAVLDLGNFGAFQQQILAERLGSSLGDLIAQTTIGALNN